MSETNFIEFVATSYNDIYAEKLTKMSSKTFSIYRKKMVRLNKTHLSVD